MRSGRKEEQYNHVRTAWKAVEHSAKRNELDTIASIYGTTRETIGEVVNDATSTDR